MSTGTYRLIDTDYGPMITDNRPLFTEHPNGSRVNDILTVLTQNIFPIFVVAGLGYLVQRQVGLDKRTLSSIVFYCLSPGPRFFLTGQFRTARRRTGRDGPLYAAGYLLVGVIGLVLARLLRFNRIETAAFLIVLMFVNGGNYGMTLNLLRYGRMGWPVPSSTT
jgi:malate permease and related proteins